MLTQNSSLSCLLLGHPGFGKTFLTQKLADTLKLTPLFFNLSQLTSLDQIVDCFDAISSLQNQRKKRPILVFFDEIDAKISNQDALSLFLSPMLDGTYRRGSHIFKLAPCIWIFAGVNIAPTKDIPKSFDFLSRINGPTVSLNCTKDDMEDGKDKTEQVYWGVKLLRNMYYDVSGVSQDVLEFFFNLNLVDGPRGLHVAVQRFRDIQYGEVKRKKLPLYSDVHKMISKNIGETKYENFRKSDKKEDPYEIKEAPPKNFDEIV